jgi:hypothetical protein
MPKLKLCAHCAAYAAADGSDVCISCLRTALAAYGWLGGTVLPDGQLQRGPLDPEAASRLLAVRKAKS